MKLATLKDGTRDGQLAVVARDLKTAHLADGIAPTLQAALDDWAFIAPQLDALYQQLNAGRAQRSFEFDRQHCMAPLPRAYQRTDAAAYANQALLMRAAAPPSTVEAEGGRDAPLMCQAASDELLGPCDEIALAHQEWGIDFGASLAIICGDVAMGATPDQAFSQIRLLMLMNTVALRKLAPEELAQGYGLLQAAPAAACSPLAITPDELDDAWKGGKVHLPLRSSWNGKLVGQPHAGVDMLFNFPQLLAHLARSRNVRAGTIVGAGVVSNKDARRGYSSIAEKRCLEIDAQGEAHTPFMAFEDSIKIEMLNGDGKSLFGAIEQVLKPYQPPAPRQR